MTVLAYPKAPKVAPPSDHEFLVREANHRIANQLALLAGLIQIETTGVARGPDMLPRAGVKAMLEKMKVSVLAMGKLHRQLADGPEERVGLASHLIENTTALFNALALAPRAGFKHHLNGGCMVTGEQAQIISLIVSEIVINAVKHAHPTGIPVQIHLACNRTADGRIHIEIGDDGVGLPEGFNSHTGNGMGLTLIRLLADRLHADLRIESDSLGLSFILLIPAITEQ